MKQVVEMDVIREFLINNGIDPEELDKFAEPLIIRDLGEGLALSLMNDEVIGMDLVMLMMQVEEMRMMLEARIAKLEGGN